MTCAIALSIVVPRVAETTLSGVASSIAKAPTRVAGSRHRDPSRSAPVAGRRMRLRIGGQRACIAALAIVQRNLGNQLLEDSVCKGFVILRGDHEGARSPDHAVMVVAVEVGLEREDR